MELNKYFFEVLRNRLENILRPLSGNYKARIVYGDTTATDIKNTVILSARNEIIPGKTPSLVELYLSYKGSTAHEGGHIRYTSLSAWQTASSKGPIFQHLTNIIEDGRIETLISERLPGAGKWIRFKNNYIYDNRPPEHYGKGLNAFLGGLIIYSVLQKIPAFLPPDIVHAIKLAAPYVDIGKAASCTEDVLPQVEKIMAIPEVQDLIDAMPPPIMLPDTGTKNPQKGSSRKSQERAEKAEKILKKRMKAKKSKEESEEENKEENKPRAKSKPEDPEESKPEEKEKPQSSESDSEKPEKSELNEKSESTEESQSSKTQDTEEESEESDTKSGDSETTSGPDKSEESEDPDSEDDSDGSDGSDDSSISGDSDDADDSSPGEDDSDLDGSEDSSTNDSGEDNSGQSDDSNPDEPDDSDDADDSLSSGNSDDIDNSDSSDSGDPGSSKGTPGGDPNNKDWDKDNSEDDFFDEPDEEEDFQELVESLEEEVSTLTSEVKNLEEEDREVDPLEGIKSYTGFRIIPLNPYPKEYQNLVNKNQVLIKNLVKEIEIAIETRKAYDLRGLNRGRLNSSSLWKLAVPDPSIFSRRIIPGDIPELAAYILVDCSGSMNNRTNGIIRIDAVKNAACVLSEACRTLKIPHVVTGFDDCGRSTYHYPAVTWDDGDSSKIPSLRSRFANRDGFSIRIAANELNLRQESRKILFVLSDGQPATNNYHGKSALNDVKNAVIETKKKGMQVISLFFGTNNLIPDFRYMYDTPVFVNNINFLPRTLGEVFKKVLLQ